jgi:DNA-binding NtrC family response regulator
MDPAGPTEGHMNATARSPSIHPSADLIGAPLVMVVDDEALVRRALVRLLEQQGYRVITASSGAEALNLITYNPVGLAVVDYHFAHQSMNGLELVRRLHEERPTLAILAITGDGDAEIAAEMLKAGAADYFRKPVDDHARFHHVIRTCLEHREEREQLEALRAQISYLTTLDPNKRGEQLIGNGPAMTALRRQIDDVARLPVPVLITGESGVGKEVVAQEIHRASAVPDNLFVAINCANLAPNLAEGALFGGEAGAWTDLRRRQAGFFETANNGTIFLDEVGELPPEVQAKLLRALNEREFWRMGGSRPIELKARVLSATNVDLDLAIRERRFREDLYYRLSVYPVRVPPLRERMEDMPTLAWHFLSKYNKEFGKNIRHIDDRAMALMQEYDWRRNNVRELQRVIQRAVISCRGEVIGERTLIDVHEERFRSRPMRVEPTTQPPAPSPYQPPPPAPSLPPPSNNTPPHTARAPTLPYAEAKQAAVNEFTVWYLQSRLREASYNITRAAELSGMQAPNFHRLMRNHDIKIPRQGGDEEPLELDEAASDR